MLRYSEAACTERAGHCLWHSALPFGDSVVNAKLDLFGFVFRSWRVIGGDSCAAWHCHPLPLRPHRCLHCPLCFNRFHHLMPKNTSRIFLGRYFWVLSQENILHFLLYFLKVFLMVVPSFSKTSLVCGKVTGMTKGSALKRCGY